MAVEFRQRTTGEYLEIIKRSKWRIALPTIAAFIAVGWVVAKLPNIYESTTLLTIKTPTISEKVAPSLTDENISERLQVISQGVLSRTSLEPLISKFNLFQAERAAGVPTEEILVRMGKNINVEFEKVDEDKVVGLRVTYRDRTPETARDVTAELAFKFIAAQNIEATQSAKTTKEFIDNQMSQAKSNLDALEKQRLEIMTHNVDTLPESAQGLIAQLDGLRKREESIGKDKETLITERGRLQEGIRSLNGQIRLLEDFTEKETKEAVSQAARIEDTPAYAQLIQRRAELNARLENLRKQYREKHPEVIQTETDIAKINDELNNLSANTEARIRQANQSGSRKAELQRKSLELEKDKADGQIAQIDQQLQAKDDELRGNSSQISALETKLNQIPGVKVALEGVDNQYQTAKAAYDELVKKYNSAQQQVERETNLLGETIRVVDPANLPQTPENVSKRLFFVLLGGAIGLAFGLALAALREVPRLSRIQSIDDAKYYTGLPVLASVPPLLSDAELASQRRARQIRLFVGAAAAVVSVPLLILALQASRLLERLS